jgi:hypothetical protein
VSSAARSSWVCVMVGQQSPGNEYSGGMPTIYLRRSKIKRRLAVCGPAV